MKPKTVCIIIKNSKGQILLQLRDNKPNIPFPNQWVTLGGSVEDGETPKEAMKRELKEEIELDFDDFSLFKPYEWDDKVEIVFQAKLNIEPEKVILHEGQEIKYFYWEEIKDMNLAFHDNEILRDYFE